MEHASRNHEMHKSVKLGITTYEYLGRPSWALPTSLFHHRPWCNFCSEDLLCSSYKSYYYSQLSSARLGLAWPANAQSIFYHLQDDSFDSGLENEFAKMMISSRVIKMASFDGSFWNHYLGTPDKKDDPNHTTFRYNYWKVLVFVIWSFATTKNICQIAQIFSHSRFEIVPNREWTKQKLPNTF